jgi:hypothetical protein
MERNKNAGRIWNPLLDAANKGSEIEMWLKYNINREIVN